MVQSIDRSDEGPQQIYDAAVQWRYRPPDERYVDLPSLYESTLARYRRSRVHDNQNLNSLWVNWVEEGPLAGTLYAAQLEDEAPAVFTNWSFAQYVTWVGGPNLPWLREMPASISANALNDSIRWRGRVQPDSLCKLYVAHPTPDEPGGFMRAVTSPTYGRIYDHQVVRAVMNLNEQHAGRWVVPGALAGAGMADLYTEVTPQSTTLYASDRDCFLFMVDERNPVEVDGELYFRGFIVSNSEVGKANLVIKTFLFKAACMNRVIWGAIQIKELRIRHTSMAPDRFIEEVTPVLAAYANASVRGIQEAIGVAKRKTIADTDKEAAEWLRERGFTRPEAVTLAALAERADGIGSSGDPTNLWDLAMAGTAYAREIPNADARVEFEEKVGGLLDRYSGVAVPAPA